MSEDHKLADTGDYNLFRYCHNDSVDFTDPMGLEEVREPWYNHQEQAKALNRLSATEAVWNRQMNFSSSFGAISYGMAAYAYQQLQQSLGGPMAAQSFSTSVTAVIRPPGAQSGIKAVQSVTINDDGSWTAAPPSVGHTDIGGHQFEGTHRTFESVKGSYPVFTAKMKGHFTSAFLPERMSIDYKFKVGVNFATHQAWVTGGHDGYPSYIVRGGGQQLYQWSQRSIWDLRPRMEIPVNTSAVGW